MSKTDAKIGLIPIIFTVGLIFINRIFLSFSFYPDIGGLEQTFTYFVQKVSLDIPFFSDPESSPYNLCQYAPGYFFIANAITRFGGVNPLSDIHQTYVICRIFNLGLNIFSSYLLFYLLRKKLSISANTAIVFSLISFCLYYVHHYGVRPDSLKNALLMFALLLLYNATNSGKIWKYLVVVLLVFFAGFVKQDSYVFVPIIFVFYWVKKDKKGMAFSFLFFLCLTVGILVPFLSQGFYYQNLILGLNQGISLPYVLKMYQYLLAPRILFFVLLFIYSIGPSPRNIESRRELNLVCFIFFLSSIFSSLKWGSTPSYFAEFFQLLLIIIAINFDKKEQALQSSILYRTIGISILIISLFMYESSVGLVRIYDQEESKKCQTAYRMRNKVKAWVQQNSKGANKFNVLSFDKSLINHLAGRAVFPTYETEFPEYMICGSDSFLPDNRPNILYKYNEFKTKFALDSVDYFITAQPGCDTVFLGIDLASNRHATPIDNYYIYMK